MAEFLLYVCNEPLDRPLSAFPSRTVEVSQSDSVADVLEAAGADRFNSFALLSDRIRDNVSLEAEQNSISGAVNLVGIDLHGAVYFNGTPFVTVGDFLRACDEGEYDGEPKIWVVYPWGSAGGWMPDGLFEVCDWLLNQGGGAVVGFVVGKAMDTGLTSISGARYRRIRNDLRKRGFTAPRLSALILKQAQWDENHLARKIGIEPAEAKLALHQCGYVRSADALWRPWTDAEALSRRAQFDAIVEAAERDTP